MREYQFPLKFEYQYKDKTDNDFTNDLVDLKNTKAFIKYVSPFYNVIFQNNSQFQGWKIHLSPILSEYNSVLRKVVKFLLKKKISFKFVPNLRDYLFMSDKNVAPSQFGKYITIYPRNHKEFKMLLEKLNLMLVSYKGVRVPTDKKYKDSSVVYYRYGGIFPKVYMNQEGDLTYDLLNGKGALEADKRQTFFTLPTGIKDPLKSTKKYESDQKDVQIIGKETKHIFIITGIIRRLGTGNIYTGIDTSDNSEIIMKEARYGSLPDWQESEYRHIHLKENEMNLLKDKLFSQTIPTSEFIDYFWNADSFFIIERKIEGLTIKDLLSSNPLLKQKREVLNIWKNDNLISVWKQISCIFINLHKLDLVINDISDDNFIISKNNKVYLIDLETICKFDNNQYRKISTLRFELNKPECINDLNLEYYKLSLLMLNFVFGRINEYTFDPSFFDKEIELLWSKMTLGQRKLVVVATTMLKYASQNHFTRSNEKNLIDNLWAQAIIEPYKNKKTYNGSIDTVLRQVKKKYQKKNLDDLKTTKYLGDRSITSLIYGQLGALICLKRMKYIKESSLQKRALMLQKQIELYDNKGQINDGLFFGLAGSAVFEFEMGISFEQNYSLFSLLHHLYNENKELNISLANGYAGIILALSYITGQKGYPNFDDLLKSLIEQSLIKLKSISVKDEGLEYGSLGLAYVILKLDSKFVTSKELAAVKEIINVYKNNYKEDKVFEGISYNKSLWPNIRSPYLMSGGAGLVLTLIEYSKVINHYDFKEIEYYLNSLDIPYAYNYGINYGAAGLLYVLHRILKVPSLPIELKNKVLKIEKQLTNFIIVHYHEDISDNFGWLCDSQVKFTDDIGSGSLGIIAVLNMIKKDH